MINNKKVGICFTPIENGGINLEDIYLYSSNLSHVKVVWKFSCITLDSVSAFSEKIKQEGVSQLVIVGDKPGEHKSFFCNAMKNAGFKPTNIFLAGLNELNGNITTETLKGLIYSASHGIHHLLALNPEDLAVNHNTLVIGGGIAGIQASLEIANAKQKVYLIEKTGTIGGHMAMFDKTFPTLDCAACILTPKMVEIGQHPDIELMTYSEVIEVNGKPGDYKVKILNKTRRVNLSTCIGCGTCTEKCPIKTSSEFDAGTTMRKAIYIPFPQAVPNKYLIDADNCRYVQEEGKCGVCVKVCPVPDCINLDDKDKTIEINVGNIVVATGFKPFDAAKATQFGYGKYPNVLTALEFERLINASGPTEGNIAYRKKDKKGKWIFEKGDEIPQSIALIHCVGSRDVNYNKYCSKVCCMYSLKLAHLVKEKLPDAEVYEYYIDMRAFGKGYEEFYRRIEDEGIKIIRGRTARIEKIENDLILRSEDLERDCITEQRVNMVILAIGLEPHDDSEKLSKILGISTDKEGWFNEANYISEPVRTNKGGVMIAGVCQGPKDIPDSVAQGSAAASAVLQNIINGYVKNDSFLIPLKQIESNVNELISMEE